MAHNALQEPPSERGTFAGEDPTDLTLPPLDDPDDLPVAIIDDEDWYRLVVPRRPRPEDRPETEGFHALLRRMVKENASDLFLKVGGPPTFRIDGQVRFLQSQRVTPEWTQAIFEIVTYGREEELGEELQGEIDSAYDVPGVGRFRVNIFRQRGYISLVFRHIEKLVPGFEELCLPAEPLTRLASLRRGLVLVTGVTGSGKSTTLASIIRYMNHHFNRHIVTLEDPIEFLFRDRCCLISQREIGFDTLDFASALKHVVRQSPDVIMVGEMRDRQTMEAALRAAETGHLVLSTLHTVNAQQTVERIISHFPPHQHELIRLQLSLVLQGVISQRLIARSDDKGGRIPAVEVLMRTPTVKDLLRDGNTMALRKALEEGTAYYGSRTFNQSLLELYKEGKITIETAEGASDNADDLKLRIRGIQRGNACDFDFDFG